MEPIDIASAPLEIERKYLIAYPDLDRIRRMPGYRVRHIEQTYLIDHSATPGGRIRRITESDKVSYVFTFKQKISPITRREFEREISEEEYRTLLADKDPDTITIVKDRHIFSYAGLCYELDVYEFWQDRATMECEVDSEDTEIPIPPCVELIDEVTLDRRYNNSQLARNRGEFR